MDRFAPSAEFSTGRTEYGTGYFEKLARALKLGSNSTVLDMACGSGEIAGGLSPYAKQIFGIDCSKAMLKNAESRNLQNAIFLEHDLNAAPYDGEGLFDVVTIGRAIPYLDVSILKNTLKRSLMPGGPVVICSASFGRQNRWLGPYTALRRQFVDRKSDRWLAEKLSQTNFDGNSAMESMAYTRVAFVEHHLETRIDLDALVRNALSYPTSTQVILANRQLFRTRLEASLSRFIDQDGALPCWNYSWAAIYRCAED